MNKNIGDEVTPIINTILERCKKEKDNGCLLVPLDDYYERVSYYTAYPKTLIQEVTGVVTPINKKRFNLDSHLLLRECIITLLMNCMSPTLTSLYNMFKVKKFPKTTYTASNFCLEAKGVKYEFRKTTEGSLILFENPNVTFQRFHYFTRMQNYRSQDKIIYYIDEMCINANLSLRKPSPKRQTTDDDEQTLFLMVSSDGYKNGLFTNQASEEVYRNWIEHVILPSLEPRSVVVLTNSYLHGHKRNEITAYHSKKQMTKWLRDKGIPYSDDMRKAELYQLIEKCAIRTKQITIDMLLKCHGHEVIHLPYTFEEISPIAFMWEHVKKQPGLLNNENVYVANGKLHSYITNLDSHTWKSFMNKCEKYEVDIADIDNQIENKFESQWQIDQKYDLDTSCDCPLYHEFIAENCKVDQSIQQNMIHLK